MQRRALPGLGLDDVGRERRALSLTRDRPITHRFPSGFAVYPAASRHAVFTVIRHSNKRQLLEN
jgi:hypothetical protein